MYFTSRYFLIDFNKDNFQQLEIKMLMKTSNRFLKEMKIVEWNGENLAQ